MSNDDENKKTEKKPEYVWSSSEPTEETANLGAGTYMVTVTDAHGSMASERYADNNTAVQEIVPTANTDEHETTQQSSVQTYLTSILESNGNIGGEDAFAFMDFINKEVNAITKDAEGNDVQTTEFPNLDSFIAVAGENAGEILGNIRGSVYTHGLNSANDPAVQQKCQAYLNVLGAPIQPTAEQIENGVIAGYGITESKAEIDAYVANYQAGLGQLFSSDNAGIKALLKQCTSFEDPATLAHTQTIIERITGQKTTINADTNLLPPDSPLVHNDDGSVTLYTNHPAIKGQAFGDALSNVLSFHVAVTDPFAGSFMTPAYVNTLLEPHKGIIGKEPAKVTGAPPSSEPAAEEDPMGNFLLTAILGIFTSNSEAEAQESFFSTVFDKGGDLISGLFGGFGDMLGDKAGQLKNGAMSMFMQFAPSLVSMVYGAIDGIKSMLGLTDSFNAVASNTGPTPTQEMKQNGADVTKPVTPVDAPPPKVANVLIPTTPAGTQNS